MSQPTLWERVKGGSKTGFDKTWQAMDKLGAPVNRLSNKLGSEAFWPTTLDKESDKAARILKTFCSETPLSSPAVRCVCVQYGRADDSVVDSQRTASTPKKKRRRKTGRSRSKR